RFMDHLPFLAVVTLVVDRRIVTEEVERNLMRKDLRSRIIAAEDVTRLAFKLFHRLCAGAADGLVRRDDDAFDLSERSKRSDSHEHDDSRAVRNCDHAMMIA